MDGLLGSLPLAEAERMRQEGATLAQVAEAAGCSITAAWSALPVERAVSLRVGRLPLEEARRMRQDGASYAEIAQAAGVSRQRVHGALGRREEARKAKSQARRIRALERAVKALQQAVR